MRSSEKKCEMSEILLAAKTKATKSAVWEHFGFERGDDGRPKQEEVGTCWLCKKNVSAKGGNTSNLLTHLKNHHPLKHAEVLKATAATQTDKTNSKQPENNL